ncbi:MAG: DUF4392 domain-containing protein [archaeon GB-1867-005]|nr:DUF4392 domain-containing protein [Candidatus Culexmicrobium cathedralense]
MSNLQSIGSTVDRLVAVDIGGRGVIDYLYEAARKIFEKPLTLKAAEEIKEAAKPGCTAIIMTGFRMPPHDIQETDGPPGAASLARALSLALEVQPVMLTEPVEQSFKILEAAASGYSLNVVNLDRLLKEKLKASTCILGFTMNEKEAYEEAKKLLDNLKPSVIIAIEKVGRNPKGEYHTMNGLNVTKTHSKVEFIVSEARKRGILTVAIGDGGNEVGMGLIADAVKKYVPYGAVCRCPCKGGIAAESKADVLIPSSISNWGGYGISAMLAILSGKAIAMHGPEDEKRALNLIVKEGALDSSSYLTEPSVDGVSLASHVAVVTMLKEIVKKRAKWIEI